MNEKAIIRLVRSATLKINYAGHTILVDPVFADKGTLQSALGVYKSPRVHLVMPISEITEGVDMVLLTHNHIDHYEPSVKQHLPKDIPFYTQPQDKETLVQDGFTNVEAIEKSKTIGNLTIHRTTGEQDNRQPDHPPHHGPSRFRSDRSDDGTRVRLCADGGGTSDHLYNGRLQMGTVHP